MALNPKMWPIIAGSLIGIAFTLFVIINAVPEWVNVDNGLYEITAGLWQGCQKQNDVKQCIYVECPQKETDDKSLCDKILTARAFVTLACILSGISAWCLFTYAVAFNDRTRMLLIAAKGLAFVCLIMGIIGVAVGINVITATDSKINVITATDSKINVKWGACAIIGIIAIIINLCGAIASVLINNSSVRV